MNSKWSKATITLIGALLFSLIYLKRSTRLPEIVLYADALYLPALVHDILHSRYSFEGWVLTPNPYFFPDMALMLFLGGIFSNIAIQAALYGLIQGLGVMAVSFGLIKTYYHKHNWIDVWSRIFLIAAMFFTILRYRPYPFELIFTSAHHFSLAIAFLLSFLVLNSYRKSPPSRSLIPAGSFLGLIGASDSVALPIIIGPFYFCLALIILQSLKNQKKKWPR